ncbi:MAG: SAM-dependent methyltransferase, partial [Planctomycetota bacterium]|nr:SAM-dependent methyltransferase [Planctomycetota bacterium]
MSQEFTQQLQAVYGMDPTNGSIAEFAALTCSSQEREIALVLRDIFHHYLALETKSDLPTRIAVLDRMVREQAFTVLNRLCALRMAEARGLLYESLAKGPQSQGFSEGYSRIAGASFGGQGESYAMYLKSLFDEFAVDLPVLFDRYSTAGLLFPGEAALRDVLAEINEPEISTLWSQDEAIGWIYQYFNSEEERKAMRDASQAPRNSRELAVRNQFFTPRYVVEFLCDNTLGRTWHEMTQGESSLADRCTYLVRQTNEIFLTQGEEAPAATQADADQTSDISLSDPVHIPFRPLKDPRDLKLLDPACGSMHFGLYAFDLFEQIYIEAWDLEASRGSDAFTRSEHLAPLHESYPDREAYQRDIPRLILERNIYGVDIDPRAVQIAALSLWLRAQRT